MEALLELELLLHHRGVHLLVSPFQHGSSFSRGVVQLHGDSKSSSVRLWSDVRKGNIKWQTWTIHQRSKATRCFAHTQFHP